MCYVCKRVSRIRWNCLWIAWNFIFSWCIQKWNNFLQSDSISEASFESQYLHSKYLVVMRIDGSCDAGNVPAIAQYKQLTVDYQFLLFIFMSIAISVLVYWSIGVVVSGLIVCLFCWYAKSYIRYPVNRKSCFNLLITF